VLDVLGSFSFLASPERLDNDLARFVYGAFLRGRWSRSGFCRFL